MKERKVAIDVLKIIATLMVVMLHINGYLNDTISFDKFSFASLFVWHLFEAFAYPAIHLFVMITAYLLIERESNSSLKSGLNSWFHAWIVGILGLLLALFFRIPVELKGAFSSAFPFMGRAYWYVSDVLVLLLLMPVLNRIIGDINKRQFKFLILTLFILISVLPTFLSVFGWKQDYSNIGLFVLLYFIVGFIKKNNFEQKFDGGGGYGYFQRAYFLLVG